MNNYYPYTNNNYYQPPYMNGFQNQQVQQQAPVQPQAPFRTNKVFVTSLDDALSRYAEPNSDMIYLHQDENLLFEIKTDMQGRKVYKALKFEEYSPQPNTPTEETNNYVTREEFEKLQAEINSLKSKRKSKEIEVEENG